MTVCSYEAPPPSEASQCGVPVCTYCCCGGLWALPDGRPRGRVAALRLRWPGSLAPICSPAGVAGCRRGPPVLGCRCRRRRMRRGCPVGGSRCGWPIRRRPERRGVRRGVRRGNRRRSPPRLGVVRWGPTVLRVLWWQHGWPLCGSSSGLADEENDGPHERADEEQPTDGESERIASGGAFSGEQLNSRAHRSVLSSMALSQSGPLMRGRAPAHRPCRATMAVINALPDEGVSEVCRAGQGGLRTNSSGRHRVESDRAHVFLSPAVGLTSPMRRASSRSGTAARACSRLSGLRRR